MSLKEIKIRVPDLTPGMYIARLDRPWTETPYLLQGFLINTKKQIDELYNYCEYVFIDVELSRSESTNSTINAPTEPSCDEKKQYLTHKKPFHYKKASSFNDELTDVRKEHTELSNVAENIMVDIGNNKNIDLPSLKKAINPMVNSIIRNPDAFTWLTRIKHKDNYTYNHLVSTSVWAVAFGRHLGLPKKDLQSLALGALLFDIGKMRLPEKLINSTKRFNQYEFKLIKTHVEHSIDIVKSINGIGDDVIEMVKTHHERHNGGGYPAGLSKNEIPIFGKIAGIVDCYDAIISERSFITALSPHDAVKKLYEWRNIDFQAELIEQFIQVVGIYPVGTIVELNDGRVGVIVAPHKVWRLRPKIMLLLDPNKEPYADFDIVDLYIETTDGDGNSIDIMKSLEPGMYGIDPEQFYL